MQEPHRELSTRGGGEPTDSTSGKPGRGQGQREFEAARPVMDLLRERLGQGVSILFSYYSPTVHKTATSYSTADLCEILPLDTRRSVRQVLDWVRPDALIFVRYDTWPNLIWQASARGIRLSLIDALLRKGSFRVSSRLGRSFSRGLYSKFHYIGAAAQSDADRLQYLCGETTTLRLVGDSRLDRVKNRKDRSRALRIPERLRNREEDVLVCGSTWPNDEERIVPALRQLLDGDTAVSPAAVNPSCPPLGQPNGPLRLA